MRWCNQRPEHPICPVDAKNPKSCGTKARASRSAVCVTCRRAPTTCTRWRQAHSTQKCARWAAAHLTTPRYALLPSRRDAQNAPQGGGRLLRMRAQCTCKGRGWFVGAQRNLALSISESPHHSKSILPCCQPTPQPSECTPAPANRSDEYRLSLT